LEPKHRAKIVTGLLGSICALAMVCLVFSAVRVLAQDSSTNASSGKQATSPKTAAPKTHGTAASGSKAGSASAKAHASANPSAGKHAKSSTTPAAHNGNTKYASYRKNSKRKPRGQQKIDSERAQAIQEALIREHYMNGEPTGTWNQASEDAMRHYQADHGWQSKQVPDSRALISLGLGPSNDHLLNPESAMTTTPNLSHAAAPVSSTSQSPVSHGADPGPRMSPSAAPSSDSLPVAQPDHDATSPQ
jgi:hypothetical protein